MAQYISAIASASPYILCHRRAVVGSSRRGWERRKLKADLRIDVGVLAQGLN